MILDRQMISSVHVPPSQFGPHIFDFVNHELRKNVIGKCFGIKGQVMDILRIVSYGDGKICSMSDKNGISYDVCYVARMFAPYKGEIIDGIVETVEVHGMIVQVGPCKIHIASSSVSLPPDITYQNGKYISDDKLVVIVPKSYVRLKILELRHHSNEIYGVGTISGDGLGLL